MRVFWTGDVRCKHAALWGAGRGERVKRKNKKEEEEPRTLTNRRGGSEQSGEVPELGRQLKESIFWPLGIDRWAREFPLSLLDTHLCIERWRWRWGREE